MQRLGHVPALDGIRGIAIALVLGYHLGWLPGGLIGVDLFFALSGFLITSLLLEERDRKGAVSLHAFYVRRARRLLPGLVAVVIAVSVAYVVDRHAHDLVYSASVLLYVGNFARMTVPHLPSGLGQMWSLGEEEQFYLVWPILLLWLLRKRTPADIGRKLLLAAIAVAVWRTVSWIAFGDGPHTLLSPDTRSDALVLGCALALARAAGYRPGRVVAACGSLALAGLLAEGAFLSSAGAVIAGMTIIAGLSVVVIAAALDPTSGMSRLLSFAPLQLLGVISYSVYLWHFAVFAALPQGDPRPVKLVAANVVGAASYRWIERPFRRQRRPGGTESHADRDARPAEATAS